MESFKAPSHSASLRLNDTPISCDDHPHEIITNFCYSSLRALCPSCINEHNKLMKQNGIFPEIDTFRNAKINCAKRCQGAILALQTELSSLDNQMIVNPTSVIEEGITQIRKVHERLISFINKYMEGLEAEYERSVLEAVSKATSAGDAGERVESLIRELENLMRNIDTDYAIPTVQKIYKIDFQSLVEKFRTDIHHTLEIRENIPSNFSDIIIDDTRFTEITNEIQRFITVRKKEHANGDKAPIEKRSAPANRSNGQEEIGFLQFHKEYRNDMNLEFRVALPDYFEPSCPRKCLHFFQNHENRFHYINIDNLNRYSHPIFQTVELNDNFIIPPFHKSIVIPNGDIYLIGGSDSDDPSQKLNTNYLFNWSNYTLIPKAPLAVPRSSFAICYMNRSIYVVGGLTNRSTFTRKCERYDINTNKWTPIADINYDVLAPCMTSFNNKYLFKFGGYNKQNMLEPYIEKYDPYRNIWTICRVRIELPSTIKPDYFKILSTSACIQVNQREIYVFGGYLEDNTSSNQTFIFRVNNENDANDDQNYTITNIGVKSLTHPEAFWNNTPVIHNRNIYALQNVQTIEHEDVCLDDKRRLICFDSVAWSSLA